MEFAERQTCGQVIGGKENHRKQISSGRIALPVRHGNRKGGKEVLSVHHQY